jgi:hypothetical protein
VVPSLTPLVSLSETLCELLMDCETDSEEFVPCDCDRERERLSDWEMDSDWETLMLFETEFVRPALYPPLMEMFIELLYPALWDMLSPALTP